MRRLLVIGTAAAALTFVAAGNAKGPSAATITGPGLKHELVITGESEIGPGTPLGALTQYAGFAPAFFRPSPNPMLGSSPSRHLGPKYEVTYRVWTPTGVDRVHQDLYPYAAGGPVTYTKPGQKIYTLKSRGGWYRAPAQLKPTLVAAGLPAKPPAESAGGGVSLSAGELTWIAIGGALGLFVIAAVALLRRRSRPAGAPSPGRRFFGRVGTGRRQAV